jgi:hypothetical protein
MDYRKVLSAGAPLEVSSRFRNHEEGGISCVINDIYRHMKQLLKTVPNQNNVTTLKQCGKYRNVNIQTVLKSILASCTINTVTEKQEFSHFQI